MTNAANTPATRPTIPAPVTPEELAAMQLLALRYSTIRSSAGAMSFAMWGDR